MKIKKLLGIFAIATLAITIPVTIYSINQQKSTQSHASETSSNSFTDPESGITSKTLSNQNSVEAKNSTKQRIYVGATWTGYPYAGCFTNFKFKLNGISLVGNNPQEDTNFCIARTLYSTGKCNKISVNPKDFRVNYIDLKLGFKGIGYIKVGDRLDNFKFTKENSVNLCDGDYHVIIDTKVVGDAF